MSVFTAFPFLLGPFIMLGFAAVVGQASAWREAGGFRGCVAGYQKDCFCAELPFLNGKL